MSADLDSSDDHCNERASDSDSGSFWQLLGWGVLIVAGCVLLFTVGMYVLIFVIGSGR